MDIFKAGVALYSFVDESDGYKVEDTMTVSGVVNVSDGQSVRGG
jgi:hypothetical protein